MGSNRFGNLFQITTWGEAHGKAVGVVIDGCPAGLPLSEEEIYQELQARQPGRRPGTSPRKEPDRPEILSGRFQGVTTGTPLSILIHNRDTDPTSYAPLSSLCRPGHAQMAYLAKYGIFDPYGGGRASARETVCRVAAGAVAKKILAHHHISLLAYLCQIGPYRFLSEATPSLEEVHASPIFFPDLLLSEQIIAALPTEDSWGGTVQLNALLPAGLGDPIYEKLDAQLAKAMLSIPASKGIEFGEGFHAATMTGSAHNDLFVATEGRIRPTTNHAGGLLGGISNGEPLCCRVAFKPTSSIRKPLPTVDLEGNPTEFAWPKTARHDPCVAIRAVPVVEAMAALVLVDALLMHRLCRL